MTTTTTPPTPQANVPAASQAHDIFTDPAIVRAKRDDPFVIFVAKYWRKLLSMAVLVAALLYGYNRYSLVQQQGVQRAADQYKKVHTQFAEVERLEDERSTKQRNLIQAQKDGPADKSVSGSTTADGAKQNESHAKLEQELKDLDQRLGSAIERAEQSTLVLRDAKAPYSGLANIYLGLLALKKGDSAKAAEMFESYNWQSAKSTHDRLFSELAALALARSLIDREDTREQGRSLLVKLVNSAEHVGLSALRALDAISSSSVELSQLAELREQFKNRHPEQIDLVERREN